VDLVSLPVGRIAFFRAGYELNGYADDTDKADERGFKKLRYTIINDKLKSAFVRLIRVVRVSIYSFPFRYELIPPTGSLCLIGLFLWPWQFGFLAIWQP
jgi:hypothetical protein